MRLSSSEGAAELLENTDSEGKTLNCFAESRLELKLNLVDRGEGGADIDVEFMMTLQGDKDHVVQTSARKGAGGGEHSHYLRRFGYHLN
jgi:hypothetical protein